ncbi:hypothetical protein O6H91_07G002600 [Diphasiastrum complanatum]|uniref:Uncharacterized protein n=1 Tax=Diphasiastrum complanatum TaxID=34168 RepID=A0ACC2D1Q0_DIPCM|nr:hypothetical protein O6H91_07G002600 [Diphasiastrum complanatum]
MAGYYGSAARMQFSYPLLERKDILHSLTQLGIGGLTEESLMKPTADVIWPLYDSLVICLEDIAREELQQPVLGALDCFKHGELNDEAAAVALASIDAITKLMFAAHATDFASRDIFRPDPARTRGFLSAVINFAMFRQEKEQAIDDVQGEMDGVIEEFLKLEEIREQFQKGIALQEAERQAQQPQVQILEVEIKELEHTISNLNKQQAALQNDIRGLKQELNSKTAEIAGNRSLLAQKKQEGFQLRGQIVQSPDKLQKMLADKRLALETAKVAADSAKKSGCKWKNKLESYMKAERKACKWQNMVDTLEKQISLQKKICKDVKEMKNKLKLNEEEDWSLSSNLRDLDIEDQHFQDLLEKLEATRSSKCEEVDRPIKEAKLQSQPILVQCEKIRTEIAKKEAEIHNMVNERVEVLATKEASLKTLYDEVDKVQDEVEKFNGNFLAAMNNVPKIETFNLSC